MRILIALIVLLGSGDAVAASLGLDKPIVSSLNGRYQAVFGSTNCLVRGGSTNWLALFDRVLFRYRAYVSPVGEFVIVAHEPAIYREELYIEIAFRDGKKLNTRLHEGEKNRPAIRPRNSSRISHSRFDHGKHGICHLFEVIEDQILTWCPVTRQWAAIEVGTGRRSSPSEKSIRSATDAFVREAADFLSLNGGYGLPIPEDYPQLDSRGYAVLLASLARSEDFSVLIPLLNAAPGAMWVTQDHPLEVACASKERTQIIEVLRSYWKLDAPPITMFDVDSTNDPQQFSIVIRVPEGIHVTRFEIQLWTPWLSLIKGPFKIRHLSQPDGDLQHALSLTKHSTFKISFKDIPNDDYHLLVALQGKNWMTWISREFKISVPNSSKTPVIVTDFVPGDP